MSLIENDRCFVQYLTVEKAWTDQLKVFICQRETVSVCDHWCHL